MATPSVGSYGYARMGGLMSNGPNYNAPPGFQPVALTPPKPTQAFTPQAYTPDSSTPNYKPLTNPDGSAAVNGTSVMAQPSTQALPKFDIQRQQAISTVNQNNSTAQEALKRRFASLGALNSGSLIQQQGIQDQQSNEEKDKVLAGINSAESDAQQARADQLNERGFQSSEADKGRQFQAAQQAGQFGFSANQQANQFGFTANQSQAERDFQQGLSDRDLNFKQTVANMDQSVKLSQLDLAQKEFDRDTSSTKFNEAIAAANSGDPQSIQQILSGIESGQYGQIFGQTGKPFYVSQYKGFDPNNPYANIGQPNDHASFGDSAGKVSAAFNKYGNDWNK